MDNEVLNVLRERRSIRSYQAKDIPEDVLKTILETATYAPTAGGHQAPVIVAVKDPAVKQELSKMNMQIANSNSDTYYGAPVIVLVLSDGEKKSFIQDGSLVLSYLMLAAKAVGISSCWIDREMEMFDSEEGKQLLDKWGIDRKYRGVGAVVLGYAAGEEPEAAPRKADYIRVIG